MNTILSTKTFIISHLLILLSALIFIGYIYYVLNGLPFSPSVSSIYHTVTSKPVSFNFEIASPVDESLVFEKALVVSGKTSANTTIIIKNNKNDLGFQADENGEFSKVIDLDSGLNEITIVAFDEAGNTKTITKTVFFSEEKI